MHKKQQDQSQIKWVSDFIWNIADDRLRDVYVRGKYRDVILPFTVLRRLDAVLEPTKQRGAGKQEASGCAEADPNRKARCAWQRGRRSTTSANSRWQS